MNKSLYFTWLLLSLVACGHNDKGEGEISGNYETLIVKRTDMARAGVESAQLTYDSRKQLRDKEIVSEYELRSAKAYGLPNVCLPAEFWKVLSYRYGR